MAIHQPAPDETALTTSAHAVGESPSGASNSPGPLTMDDAVEIAELCTLAGCPEATSEFLRQRSSAVTVRQILLNRRVQAETIQSHITPLSPAATRNDDVMRQAVERKIAQQTNKGV